MRKSIIILILTSLITSPALAGRSYSSARTILRTTDSQNQDGDPTWNVSRCEFDESNCAALSIKPVSKAAVAQAFEAYAGENWNRIRQWTGHPVSGPLFHSAVWFTGWAGLNAILWKLGTRRLLTLNNILGGLFLTTIVVNDMIDIYRFMKSGQNSYTRGEAGLSNLNDPIVQESATRLRLILFNASQIERDNSL